MGKPYFHEAPQEEIDNLLEQGKTWGDIMQLYSQPKWCEYPNALEGTMGCWSLIDIAQDGLRTKISEDFCKGCDCFIKSTENEKDSLLAIGS